MGSILWRGITLDVRQETVFLFGSKLLALTAKCVAPGRCAAVSSEAVAAIGIVHSGTWRRTRQEKYLARWPAAAISAGGISWHRGQTKLPGLVSTTAAPSQLRHLARGQTVGLQVLRSECRCPPD
mmetsp:Transcript_34881/g.73905  ORF Transcript_34881/g.73905 Transcript_34881/m.73905 type:complete len:125 (+) Transcript_34881:1291-1665(+)